MAFDLLRTVLAVCAVYAFVVQGFAGGAEAMAGPSLGVLCGHDQTGSDGPNHPAGQRPTCCIAGCLAGTGPLPLPDGVLLPPMPRVAMTIGWRILHADAEAPQPRLAFHPRGPPRV